MPQYDKDGRPVVRVTFTPDDLPDDWSFEERCEFLIRHGDELLSVLGKTGSDSIDTLVGLHGKPWN